MSDFRFSIVMPHNPAFYALIRAENEAEAAKKLRKYIDARTDSGKSYEEMPPDDDIVILPFFPNSYILGHTGQVFDRTNAIRSEIKSNKKKKRKEKKEKRVINKNFTEIDDIIIKLYYPIMGRTVSKLFSDKTFVLCEKRALSLGLDKFVRSKEPWSEEEIKILRENYPSKAQWTSMLLSGRSARDCVLKANNLNIVCTHPAWTEGEDEIIRQYYPIMGGNVYKLLPGKTASVCRNRAQIIQVWYNKTWTKEEDRILKEFYPTMNSKVIELLPGKTEEQCIYRASHLIEDTTKQWTDIDDIILKIFYPVIGTDVSKVLADKTEMDCFFRAEKHLGLYVGQDWV